MSDGRSPPSDLDAEAAVLSAILLSPVSLDEVLGFLRGSHFYADRNRHIFEAAVELHDSGQPIDIVSVASLLREREMLQKVGGSPYLAQLSDATPAVSHIEHHARTIVQRWQVRQVVFEAQRIAAEGYADVGSVEDWLQQVDQRVFQVTRSEQREDRLIVLADATHGVLDNARQGKTKRHGATTGLPTLDARINGLEPGRLYVVAARPGAGKAQPLSAKVHTPFGWTTMGDIREGDLVTGASGKPVRVRRVFERGELPVFRVTMADGGSTMCCDEHLWFTRTRVDRRYGGSGSVKPLSEIRATMMRCASGGLNHSIPYVKPIEFEPSALPLPLHPYVLGVYLGDGCKDCVISNPEPDVQQRFASLLPDSDQGQVVDDGITLRVSRKRRNNQPSTFAAAIRSLKLSGALAESKFIPSQYLAASVEERLELLRGLCDTDGYVIRAPSKNIEYTTVSERLAQQVQLLVRGLGGKITCTTKKTTYTYRGKKLAGQLAYRMVFGFPSGGIVPVTSSKHLSRWDSAPIRLSDRFIKSVDPAGVEVCRCIELESEDHLYVTDDYIVTHNTALASGIALSAAGWGSKLEEAPTNGVVFVSLEMPREQIANRVLSQVARIDSKRIQRNQLDKSHWDDLILAQQKIAKLPIAIEDSSTHSPSSIRAAVRQGLRRLQDRFGKQVKLTLVAIDYLQLLKLLEHSNNRENEVSELSRFTKALAKDEGVAVLSMAQVNRECEKRTDKRPQLSDLRESGSVEQDADGVIFVYRDDYYRPKHEAKDNKAELIVAKLRDGQTGTVFTEFEPTTTTFYETSKNPDLEQLGDIFDDYLPGTYGEETGGSWQDKY